MCKQRIVIFLLAVFATVLNSCTVLTSLYSSKNVSNDNTTAYSEDLSAYRPTVIDTSQSDDTFIYNTVDTTLQSFVINESLNQVIDSISVLQLKENKVSGFTVLVHTGTSREEALAIKGQLVNIITDFESEVIFQQPFFKVKIGKFQKQIQAVSLLNRLKNDFPKAIVVPDTFPVKSSGNEE
ncbi:MAG: hypothetical protein OEW75_16550 [Cyclobacteriaceae bacterium]|nr:hypothetical protein [Cyclobacteriaceae bacterium]